MTHPKDVTARITERAIAIRREAAALGRRISLEDASALARREMLAPVLVHVDPPLSKRSVGRGDAATPAKHVQEHADLNRRVDAYIEHCRKHGREIVRAQAVADVRANLDRNLGGAA